MIAHICFKKITGSVNFERIYKFYFIIPRFKANIYGAFGTILFKSFFIQENNTLYFVLPFLFNGNMWKRVWIGGIIIIRRYKAVTMLVICSHQISGIHIIIPAEI